MNATQSKITHDDPYMARFSLTLPQLSAPIARWALQNGIKSVFAIYLDLLNADGRSDLLAD